MHHSKHREKERSDDEKKDINFHHVNKRDEVKATVSIFENRTIPNGAPMRATSHPKTFLSSCFSFTTVLSSFFTILKHPEHFTFILQFLSFFFLSSLFLLRCRRSETKRSTRISCYWNSSHLKPRWLKDQHRYIHTTSCALVEMIGNLIKWIRQCLLQKENP